MPPPIWGEIRSDGDGDGAMNAKLLLLLHICPPLNKLSKILTTALEWGVRDQSPAMTGETGNPSAAYLMAGENSCFHGNLPNLSCSSHHPITAPGTETGRGPFEGIDLSKPFVACAISERISSMEVDLDERPEELMPLSLFPSGFEESYTIAIKSPPIPFIIGSTTPSIALAAIAIV